MESTEKREGDVAVGSEVALRADRIMALALPAGVAAFWTVSVALDRTRPDASSLGGVGVGTATLVVAGLALAGLIAAFMLRMRALAHADGLRRSDAAAGAVGFAAFRTKLIMSWALLEGPALLAGVVHFMSGAEQPLLYVGPLYLLGVALTFPRAEWYGAEGSGSRLG